MNGELTEWETCCEFLLGKDYVPPTGLKKWMQVKIGDWPIYSMFLALHVGGEVIIVEHCVWGGGVSR
jgi:hypothetical protein